MNLLNKIMIRLKILKVSHEELHNLKLKSISNQLQIVNNKLALILPDELKEQFEQTSFISGGCIYSMYQGEDPKDYDFFLTSQAFARSLREFFIDASGYHGDKISGGQYKNYPLIVTENAISIGKYQIITRWIGTPEEVIEQFDFEHLMCYFVDGQIKTLSSFDSLKSRELKYNVKRARDIVGTVMRCNKFVSRGMYIKQKEMSKILLKLHEVGFDDRELEILHVAGNDSHFGS